MSLPPDEFDRLMLAEADAMYRLARRLTRTAEAAEELVQETVARALASRSAFAQQGYGIKPWLLRVMYNLHLNRAGRERRQPAAAEPEVIDANAGVPARPTDDPQHMDQELVRALEDLPADTRATLLLWAVEGLSYKEIAAAMDVPIGTVMSRLHRGRKRLAEQLRPYAAANRLIPGLGRE